MNKVRIDLIGSEDGALLDVIEMTRRCSARGRGRHPVMASPCPNIWSFASADCSGAS